MTLTCRFAGVLALGMLASLSCPLALAEVDFDTEIVPVLSKAGCNAAACHGGAAGRGGFRLSLFGGDPDFDYRTIVRELEGRRVNPANPSESLLLAKPLGRLEHGGERRFAADSLEAKLIHSWIAEGAGRPRLRKLARLEVRPTEFTAVRVPAEVTLAVTAHFDDGVTRDAGSLAVYSTSDDSAVAVSPTGTVTVARPGRHIVLVRFGSLITPVQLTAPLGEDKVDLAEAPRRNWIDDEIFTTLESLRLPPSPQCDDPTFLRRAFLDLTGRLPTPKRVTQFLADSTADKRQRLIDELLASDEFVDFWTYRLAVLLRVWPPRGDPHAADALHAWLREQVRQDAGWDETARTLLTATGDSQSYGPAMFHRLASGPREEAEYVSETLMGVRMRCANCHNHPLDLWTQDDYHGLAQIFARLERGRNVRLLDRGEVTHPRTGKAARARIPGVGWIDLINDDSHEHDGREQLADWLTHPDNPYFAHAIVGRIWRNLMGRGLVEPVDDQRATNPPTHPALFDRLAADFVAHGYRIRHTIRLICNSAAYARGSVPTAVNEADDRFYSHALVRPLVAEVLSDAIGDVTGVYDDFAQNPGGTRAIELVDTSAGAATLDVLGRCDRSESCEAAPAGVRGIAAKLHLLNGPLLNRRLVAKEGRLQQLIDAEEPMRRIVDEFYLRALSRPPKKTEAEYWFSETDSATDEAARTERIEDFVWSLLNSEEFMTNH